MGKKTKTKAVTYYLKFESQGHSQTKWEAVYGMGAQTRFGQKEKANKKKYLLFT